MRKLAYLIFLLVLAGARSAAQPAPDDNTPPANPGDVTIKETAAPKLIVTKGTTDTLSVDFPNEDIRTILRNVADLFDLNLVIPDTLQGKASIKLRDVTWRQIFQVVLNPVGYTFVEDNNIIKVVSLASLQQEPTTTEVFILNYAKAADISPSITPMISTTVGGKIQVDTRANALIITERPTTIKRVARIIDALDKPTEQVMIESKFIEVDGTDSKDLGINWSSLDGYTVGTLGQIQNSLGASTTTNGGSSGPTLNSTLGSTLKTLLNSQGAASATFSASQFQLILSALQANSNTRLVSNPTVVTLNNTEAFINVGEEYPIPSYQFNQQTGTFEVSGFEYKDIGIILKVTPQVNSQGFIKLTLQPEVSSTSTSVNFGGSGGATIPIIQTRKAVTEVTLKDGNTLGIGGLMSTTTNKSNTDVPFLGDIPVLGRLFKSDNNNENKQDLLIFITAKSLNPEGADISQVFDPRLVRDLKVQRDELPGYRDNSDPFAPLPAPVDSKGAKSK
jgi:type IV pilus assembly protein PilQ